MTIDRGNPLQWAPPADKPDMDCTLLELWARYSRQIAEFRNFQAQDATIRSYTTTLLVIQDALSRKPAAKMLPFDCWDAAVSVRFHPVRGGQKPYANSTLKARLTIMQDIYLYAETRVICSNPLRRPPWALLNAEEDFSLSAAEIQASLRQKAAATRPEGFLSREQERRLMKKIKRHWKEDGRWIGMLVYLATGVRPSEGRGLTYSDLHRFSSLPERGYLTLHGTADAAGGKRAQMKNKYSFRRIPMAYELDAILQQKMLEIRRETGQDDIGTYPVICFGRQFRRACTATEMAFFARDVLESIVSREDLDAAAVSMYGAQTSESWSGAADGDAVSADQTLTTYILRHNYCTKLNAETNLSDREIRLLMGHETDAPKYAYAEPSLLHMLPKMDQRMLDPELHGGWNTRADGAATLRITDACEHVITLPPHLTAQGLELHIHMEAQCPGDDILVRVDGNLPPDALCVQSSWAIDFGTAADIAANRAYEHWRLPGYEKDKH